MVASISLNLFWATVLQIQAYQHHFKFRDDRWGTASFPSLPFVPSSLTSKRQCDASIIEPNPPPKSPTRRLQPKLEGGTISPALIPSRALNCQMLYQPRLLKNQNLVCFTPKPFLSNLAHFITPVIRHLLPQRTTCSVSPRAMQMHLPDQVDHSETSHKNPTCFYLMSGEPPLCLNAELAPAACGEGWRGNWDLLVQELQDERHPHKRNPDGALDGWKS